MKHTDNIISDTNDQIQHSDYQPAQAAGEDIAALFARLNPQDVEHFYQSYRHWNIQPRIQTLHMEITALQQAIARNTELMDQYHPTPGAQAILAQFQTNGVNDLDLLDRMLERGDDWLDHIMQLLEQCERLDIIHGNYTEWCEHALEGAYDWIGSMSEDDDTSVESTESAPLSSEVFDESTEQLLLQKLLSEEEEATQIPDPLEQPVNKTASEEHATDASTELPATSETSLNEADHTATPQPAQEKDEEKQTTGESSIVTINDAADIDTSSSEELILFPTTETDLPDDEGNAADLVAVQDNMADDIEVLGIEDEVNETNQQEPPATEVATSLTVNKPSDTQTAEITDAVDGPLESKTAEATEITDAVDSPPDSKAETAEVTEIVDGPLDTATSEVMDLIDAIEVAAIEIEPDQADRVVPTEEPIAHTAVTSQDIASLSEEQPVEKIEAVSFETMPEASDVDSALEQLNETTMRNGLQDSLTEVSNIAEPGAFDEIQQPTNETSINAEEIIEPILPFAALTTDADPVILPTIEQAETVQETTTVEITITQESEDEMLIQEPSPEESGEQTTGEEGSEQQQAEDHKKADADDKTIEQLENEIPSITRETTTSSDEDLVYGRDDGSASSVSINEHPASEALPVSINEHPASEASTLSYPSNGSGSDEDTIAIPKITFSTSRTTPQRIPAIAKPDTQQVIPESIADQIPSPRENITLTESATIPHLQALIMQTPQPHLPAPLETPLPQLPASAPLKEQAEATIIMEHQHQTNASYTQQASHHYPTPIWREYQNQPLAQPASEILPQPRPGFFRRLWLWFLAWLKG